MCGVEVHTVNRSPPFGLEGEGTKRGGGVIGTNGEYIRRKGEGVKENTGRGKCDKEEPEERHGVDERAEKRERQEEDGSQRQGRKIEKVGISRIPTISAADGQRSQFMLHRLVLCVLTLNRSSNAPRTHGIFHKFYFKASTYFIKVNVCVSCKVNQHTYNLQKLSISYQLQRTTYSSVRCRNNNFTSNFTSLN